MLTAQKIAVNDMRGMCKRESRHIATSFFGVERLAGRCMKNKHKDNINELHCTRSISFRNAVCDSYFCTTMQFCSHQEARGMLLEFASSEKLP